MVEERIREDDGVKYSYWWNVGKPQATELIIIGKRKTSFNKSEEEFGIQRNNLEDNYTMYRTVEFPRKQNIIWEFSNLNNLMQGNPEEIYVALSARDSYPSQYFSIVKGEDGYVINKRNRWKKGKDRSKKWLIF